MPAIFTLSGRCGGQGAVLNEDGTVNSATSAAARGSVVMIYATGAGRMEPPQQDREITGFQLPLPSSGWGWAF